MAKKKTPKPHNQLDGKTLTGPIVSSGPAPAVSPTMARDVIEKRQIKAKSLSEFKSRSVNPIRAFAAQPGRASNTVTTPAMTVAELARALKNDVDLIFYHVYNNIEFHATYGLQKDSLATMIDGTGNAFDQCNLLVDLLTEAGYTASFLFGELDLSQDEVSAWIGGDSANIFNSANILSNGGIPNEAIWNGSVYRIDVNHVWVKVTIDSTDYILDPAFKTYTSTVGINLATAMSYNQTTFLDKADDGATIDGSGNWIEDVNEGKIATELETYSDNLVDWINTNNPDATMNDIVGGRSIVQIDSPVRETTNPHQKSGQTPTAWTSIPNTYRITVRFKYLGIDETLYGDEIHGRRITLFYNGSDKGELKIDGTLVGTTTNAVVGNASMEIVVTHPYAVTWYDQTVFQWLDGPSGSNKFYHLIGANFGVTNQNLVDYHSKVFEANSYDGNATDEDVLGSRLAVRWHNWVGQFFGVADVLGRIADSHCTGHHQIGRCSMSDFPTADVASFDIQGARAVVTSLSGTLAEVKKYGMVLAMHGYCLEQLAMQQITGEDAYSATTVLQAANAAGDKIYKGTSSNWTADVTPNLTGYNATDLSNIKSWYLDNGWYALISETAPITQGIFDNTAWAVVDPNGGALGIINQSLGGGGEDGNKPPRDPRKGEHKEGDPVGVRSGAYIFSQSDMTLGSGEFPYKLDFQSQYDSRDRYKNETMGVGWKHNWLVSASESSNGFKGLGSESPIDAVASIVEFFIHLDLLDDTDFPILNIVSGSLCNSWWADQLTNNIVVVDNIESLVLEYTRLPDGSYNPPAGDVSTLVKNMDNSFTLTDKHDVVKEFDTDGNLETWEFPNGVTITLTYSSGKLSTISNGIGRTITLTYTGDKLTSISDGNSRSVDYSYDVDDQLDAITDLVGEDTTFEYGDLGLLEKYFYPENPLDPFITNTYDSIDRVESQLDMNGEQVKYYLAGWRSEIENALGNSRVWEHDRQGQVTKTIDELGNETSFVYDGLQRLTSKTMPEGNAEAFTYDSKNNVLTKTKSAKPESSLNDIVETFTYNSTYNKVATHEDGRGNTTTFTYDVTTGNLTKIERPDIGLDTPTVTMTYNSRGQMLTSTDETGIKTKHEYDTSTEVLDQTTIDEGMGRLNLVTAYTYNDWGDSITVTDPNGNVSTLTFDDKRRLTQKVDPSPLSYVTKYTYDKNDNAIKLERQTGDVGNPWQVWQVTYNLAGRIASIKDPLNKQITRVYDDLRRLWKFTDQENRTTEFQYDERNMLKKVIKPGSIEEQAFTYTDNGLRASATDALGSSTNFTYDGFDRLDKTSYPGCGNIFEQNALYDANGNILQKITRAGEEIDFEFDVLNRMTMKSPEGMAVVTYEYDLAGRLTSSSTPAVVGNPASGEWEFGFDTAGRFTSEEAPDGKTASYELDDNGNITKITYPDSYYVDRVYDELNRLTDIKLNGSMTSAAEFEYDDLSRRTRMIFDNGVETDLGYALNDDLSSIEHAFIGSDLDFTLGYNDAKQLVSQQVSDSQYMWHPAAAGTTEYGSVNGLNQYPYVSGSCGRLFKGYNANGCLIDDGVWKFEYDSENHLISADDGTTSVDFVYDPMHRQIQKDVGATKTRYVYSGWQMLADYDGSTDTLQDRYVYGANLDEPLIKVSSAGVLTYMHSDRLGSIVALTDNTGAVSNRYSYSPWGDSASMSGTIFGYTGQRYDSETGLYYYKNRYYSAKLGRFLQPDPIGYGFEEDENNTSPAAALNLYQYTDNDPLNNVDPMGTFPGWLAALGSFAISPAGFIVIGSLLALLALFLLWKAIQDEMREGDKKVDPHGNPC